MTAQEAISYIESCTWSTTRLGLGRTKELLEKLGNPQKMLRFIHVAGTNGKGSACAMTASVLEKAGYRVGLYTSPYICRFNERMQINGVEISNDALARYTSLVQPIADAMDDHPSQFELITAIGMLYFLEENCDFVVLEVGLGGELDSTNAIDCPELALLMNIGLDHTEYLGNSIAEIACAKAGIIKPGCTAVCYRSGADTEAVFEQVCKEKSAELIKADFDSLRPLAHSTYGQSFSWKGKRYELPLLGEHQQKNAAVVLEGIEILRQRGFNISDTAIFEGLKSTRWPARFEIICRDPVFIVDGAHNPQCTEALAQSLEQYFYNEKFIVVCGVLADKDYEHMLSCLLPHAAEFICITPDSPRALRGSELAEIIASKGAKATSSDDIQSAVRLALAHSQGKPVLACGSLYMVGDVKKTFPSAIKEHYRKAALSARRKLSGDLRRDSSLAAAEKIRESAVYKKANCVMLYKATPDELDLSLLEEEDKVFVYPRCTGKGIMCALRPADSEAFILGSYGISEPDPQKSELVSPEDIDLVICPCAGFDKAHHRIGMGKGYYDRFLPSCKNAAFIGAAFESQLVPDFPAEDFDCDLSAIYTEKNIY